MSPITITFPEWFGWLLVALCVLTVANAILEIAISVLRWKLNRLRAARERSEPK